MGAASADIGAGRDSPRRVATQWVVGTFHVALSDVGSGSSPLHTG